MAGGEEEEDGEICFRIFSSIWVPALGLDDLCMVRRFSVRYQDRSMGSLRGVEDAVSSQCL